MNISVEESLLAAMDNAAKDLGETRSGFIATACRRLEALRDEA